MALSVQPKRKSILDMVNSMQQTQQPMVNPQPTLGGYTGMLQNAPVQGGQMYNLRSLANSYDQANYVPPEHRTQQLPAYRDLSGVQKPAPLVDNPLKGMKWNILDNVRHPSRLF